MTIVGSVEIFDCLTNEVKFNKSIDFAHQMIFGNQFLAANEFHTVFLLLCSLNMPVF